MSKFTFILFCFFDFFFHPLFLSKVTLKRKFIQILSINLATYISPWLKIQLAFVTTWAKINEIVKLSRSWILGKRNILGVFKCLEINQFLCFSTRRQCCSTNYWNLGLESNPVNYLECKGVHDHHVLRLFQNIVVCVGRINTDYVTTKHPCPRDKVM